MRIEKPTEQKLKSALLEGALERLRESEKEYDVDLGKRGLTDGVRWATRRAEYAELENLAERYEEYEVYDTDEDDEEGAPGLFLRLIGGVDIDDEAVDEFWRYTLGKDARDPVMYKPEYWDAFIKGAISVFEQV
jgi:hypothetical protein